MTRLQVVPSPPHEVAGVERVRVSGTGQRTVVVRCPRCAATHSHGWPLLDDVTAWRASHCVGGRATYRIDLPADAPSARVAQLIIRARLHVRRGDRATAGDLRELAQRIAAEHDIEVRA